MPGDKGLGLPHDLGDKVQGQKFVILSEDICDGPPSIDLLLVYIDSSGGHLVHLDRAA